MKQILTLLKSSFWLSDSHDQITPTGSLMCGLELVFAVCVSDKLIWHRNEDINVSDE